MLKAYPTDPMNPEPEANSHINGGAHKFSEKRLVSNMFNSF